METKMEKKSFPAQSNTITLDEAITRTANWRQQIAGLFTPQHHDAPAKGIQDEIPKCMFINLMDIYQIVNDYSLLGHTISGIRIYFTLENANKKKDFHLTGIVVPTVQGPTAIVDEHKDLIITIPVAGNAPDEDSSGDSIYDFTRPCPTYCSGTTDSLTGAS
jgi:hypothetical protein